MFRFDNYLETWAKYYKPISHEEDRTKKHFTFFRIGMIDGNSEFIRNHASTPSPCMAYATHIDAELSRQNPKAISYRHVIYILVRQADGGLSRTIANDEDAATEARFESDRITQDLLAYLFALKGFAGGKAIPESFATAYAEKPEVLAALFPDTLATDQSTREALRGLQLDQSHWGTLPTALNGWQICGLTIEQIHPRELCMNPERYINT